MDQIKIGKFISERRKALKLTQEELGEKLGVSKNAVSKWERGLNLPDSGIYVYLCEILNISLNELFKGDYIKECEIQKQSEKNILNIYEIQEQLEKANNRKIWLKSGGFITIDKTEALTAIDVNSGKYVGTKDLEKTIFTVNKEATIEITKQIRLRDIGGIIIIDYIDMENKEDKAKILEILEENLKKDRSKTQVIGFTPLDLLEMTRKHMWSND